MRQMIQISVRTQEIFNDLVFNDSSNLNRIIITQSVDSIKYDLGWSVDILSISFVNIRIFSFVFGKRSQQTKSRMERG